VSNNSFPCLLPTQSNTLSSPCAFRTYIHHPLQFCIPICLLSSRHINDSSHRETYESSHSAILALFAAHALGRPDSTTVAEIRGTRVSQPTFVEKIVPFYVRCLLEVRSPNYVHLFAKSDRLYRIRQTESSPPRSCVSLSVHLSAAQAQVHLRWVSFASPLSCPRSPAFPRRRTQNGDTVCTSFSYRRCLLYRLGYCRTH
jgi:hypothetical protein